MSRRLVASGFVGAGFSRLRDDAGLSLIEATIILMVLSVLTATIAPAAGAYLEESRNTKAKADVEAIGGAIDQLVRDTGVPCVSFNGSSCDNATTGRVELLMSGTSVSANEPVAVPSALSLAANLASATALNWAGGTSAVAAARRDLMDTHFVTNTPSTPYTEVGFSSGGGPRPGTGWRGPYVNGPIDVDPWGYAYQASTLFLAVAAADTGVTDGTSTGQRRGGWTNDVVVISAGSNGTIQTAFGATGSKAVGDDVVYLVQGATR